jgi:hypothetical protein
MAVKLESRQAVGGRLIHRVPEGKQKALCGFIPGDSHGRRDTGWHGPETSIGFPPCRTCQEKEENLV